MGACGEKESDKLKRLVREISRRSATLAALKQVASENKDRFQGSSAWGSIMKDIDQMVLKNMDIKGKLLSLKESKNLKADYKQLKFTCNLYKEEMDSLTKKLKEMGMITLGKTMKFSDNEGGAFKPQQQLYSDGRAATGKEQGFFETDDFEIK